MRILLAAVVLAAFVGTVGSAQAMTKTEAGQQCRGELGGNKMNERNQNYALQREQCIRAKMAGGKKKK
jgi:hypothetical protein